MLARFVRLSAAARPLRSAALPLYRATTAQPRMASAVQLEFDARATSPSSLGGERRSSFHSDASSIGGAPALAAPVLAETAFFLCDVQERFRSHIYGFAQVVATASKMTRAGAILNVPLVVTEQNPHQLGATAAEINVAGAVANLPKMRFSMVLPETLALLHERGVRTVVLFGIESHVCILQTALDLRRHGVNVTLLADGISSMNPGEVPVALARLRAAGCVVSSSDSVLFELLGDATHPSFKEISQLVKQTKDATAQATQVLSLLSAKF